MAGGPTSTKCNRQLATSFIWQHWRLLLGEGRVTIPGCTASNTRYLLTPWSRVLLEKLNGSQLVKKFPAFYGTRRFITAFTSALHLSLSWASSIQSIPPHPARGGAVGWGTALQAGRSRVRLPTVPLDFFHWHNPSGRTMTLGST